MLVVTVWLLLSSDVEIRCDAKNGIELCRELPIDDGGLLVAELSGAGCANATVHWQRRTFKTHPVGSEKHHALLPVPLNATVGAHLLAVGCAERKAGFVVHVRRADYPESELRVGRRFSRPPPPRVDTERAAIASALKSPSDERLWRDSFQIPRIDSITSVFGVRRVFNDVLQSQHRGLDIDGVSGRPVYATNDGVVTLVADHFFYVGNAVIIDHGRQLYSMYFHFSSTAVKQGDRVRRGQLIGSVGRTGRVTGPHLHFSFKLAGLYIDPLDVLAYTPVPLRAPLLADRGRIERKLGFK